jgi:hypothetical protein
MASAPNHVPTVMTQPIGLHLFCSFVSMSAVELMKSTYIDTLCVGELMPDHLFELDQAWQTAGLFARPLIISFLRQDDNPVKLAEFRVWLMETITAAAADGVLVSSSIAVEGEGEGRNYSLAPPAPVAAVAPAAVLPAVPRLASAAAADVVLPAVPRLASAAAADDVEGKPDEAILPDLDDEQAAKRQKLEPKTLLVSVFTLFLVFAVEHALYSGYAGGTSCACAYTIFTLVVWHVCVSQVVYYTYK